MSKQKSRFSSNVRAKTIFLLELFVQVLIESG